MTGSSVAQRPPKPRERPEQSTPNNEERRRRDFAPAIFTSRREALGYLPIWIAAGLLVYAVLLAGLLVVLKL